MSFRPSHNSPTPECLMNRSDSKNPATTCRGITKRGLPCRNAIASPTSTSLDRRRLSAPPTLNANAEQNLPSAFCHLHKDQALQSQEVDYTKQPKRRTSTDTLVAKFNGLEVSSSNDHHAQASGPPKRHHHSRNKQRPSLWASLCCMTGSAADSEEDDYVELVRHRRRKQSAAQQPIAVPEMSMARPTSHAIPQQTTLTTASPSRPSPHRMPASAPAELATSHAPSLKKHIPATLDARIAANLLTELSKPISEGDQDGYIYIFWLTPENRAAWKPTDDDAESLLQSAPHGAQSHSVRAQDELIRAHSVVRRSRQSSSNARPADTVEQRTILLKIGRASNVYRRMHEWTRQCGYNLSLIRFYPYVPSSQLRQASPSPSPGAIQYPLLPQSSLNVRKVPHSHRVERLIHIELAATRSKDQGKCAACGREHREWFEIEASRKGVKSVDEVVKRWVRWAEDLAAKSSSI